jgi:hypothetical protein
VLHINATIDVFKRKIYWIWISAVEQRVLLMKQYSSVTNVIKMKHDCFALLIELLWSRLINHMLNSSQAYRISFDLVTCFHLTLPGFVLIVFECKSLNSCNINCFCEICGLISAKRKEKNIYILRKNISRWGYLESKFRRIFK